MRIFRRVASLPLAVALALSCAAAYAQDLSAVPDQDVFGPMKAELARAMTLKQDDFGPPYFVAYRVVDEKEYDATAAFGSALQDSFDRDRVLFAEVRFGDRHLDNTDVGYRGWHVSAAPDPKALRQNLWYLTDAAYKNAVAGYLQKKAKRATEYIADPLDDFSVEKAVVRDESQPPPDFPRQRAREAVEAASRPFRNHPQIYEAHASIRLRWARRYLVTSEGTELATPEENVPGELHIDAMTRADDGMRLDDHRSWEIRTLADLPSDKDLAAAAEAMARELEAERRAPVQPPAAAPAIFDPEFTGVLFHEALGHKLEGQRQRDPQESQVFRDMVGKKILPDFISVLDDPTMAAFRGEPVHGHYDYDSEGVPAQKVALVDHGVLRNFLMSRWPVKGFSHSNGHGRSDAYLRPTGRMANLIVRGEHPVSRAKLKRKLLELLRKSGKPYGFLLVGAFGGENPNSRDAAQTLEVRPRLIYRVDAKTGKETLVRGVSMVGTPLIMLNRIVAASNDDTLANGFVCGAESGWVSVDQIAPSVLASEIELQRLPEDRSRPPILPSPFAKRHEND